MTYRSRALGNLTGAERPILAWAVPVAGLVLAASISLASAAAPAADPASAEAGKQLFETVGCSSCHGMEGEGVTAPRLVGSQAIKNPATLIQRILYGGGDMPPFDHLTEAEVAAIANYVRTGLNDRTDVVKPEDVAASK